MDIDTLEIPDTVTVHLEFKGVKLYDDDNKKKPVTIELYSPASDQAIDYTRKIQRKAMAKMQKSRNKSLSLTPEEIEEQNIERLVAFTAGVSNLNYKGEKINPKNIKGLYEDPKMGWLCDQLSERLGSWDDFLEL